MGSTLFELVKKPVLMIRSALIGLVVGLAPGAGGNIASMVSYGEAQRWDRDRDAYGKGTINGVAASEAANSAMAPGSLIPLLTLGIPGSPPSAVILGALLLHGLQPGEELFSVYGDIVYAFIIGLGIAALMVGVLGSLGSFLYARIVNVPSRSLAPLILVMTVLGSYAIRNNMLDVWVMLGFGIIGLLLAKLSYHPAPLVLGFILGPYIEDGLVQSMMIGGASGDVFGYMTSRPISIVLICLCAITMAWPLLLAWQGRNTLAQDETVSGDGKGINGQLVTGITGVALAAFVWLSIGDLSRFGRLFVEYSAAALAIFSILAIASGLIHTQKVRVFNDTFERNRVLLGIAALTVYLLLIPLAGFLLSSILFYISIFLLVADEPQSPRTLLRVLLVSSILVTGLFLLFRELLGVPLPAGVFA